eukprot:4379487-Amphidinium_carterae.1
MPAGSLICIRSKDQRCNSSVQQTNQDSFLEVLRGLIADTAQIDLASKRDFKRSCHVIEHQGIDPPR